MDAQIPVINYADRSDKFGDSSTYNNIFQVVPRNYLDAKVLAILLSHHFGWHRVSIFATTDDYGRYALHVFEEMASRLNIEILSQHSFAPLTTDFTAIIEDTKKYGARIFVMLTNIRNGWPLLKQGHEQKLFVEGTQILGGEDFSEGKNWDAEGKLDAKAGPYLKGYIGVQWEYWVDDRLFPNMMERWISRPNTLPDADGSCNEAMDYYHKTYLHQFHQLQTQQTIIHRHYKFDLSLE